MRALLPVLLLSAAPLLATAAEPFVIGSTDLKPGGTIGHAHVFKGFGCEGGNVSPQLVWQNAPAGTQSYALTVYDPDAPTGSGWWHWVAFNIPATMTSLPQGAGNPKTSTLPAEIVQGRTDFGVPGYGGPCPPTGDKPHRYIFTVHALKVPKLELGADAPAAMVGYMINANKLGEASFTAFYGR